MKATPSGVEIYNVHNNKEGLVFFESGDLYISKAGGLPIKLKSVKPETLAQIGDFFHYYGKDTELAANRIDFPFLTIKIMRTQLYFSQNGMTIIFESVGPNELKKFGTWLRKQS